MSLKAKIEAIIYAAEEPITLEGIAAVLRESGLVEELLGDDHVPADSADKDAVKTERKLIHSKLRAIIAELAAEYANSDRGMEVREVANGFRISTKPEHHDVIRSFAKSLKPPIRLSLQALETLAVIAYKQRVTAPEISEISGVDSSAVLATLIDRKLITTAGRKHVVGRPMLYKTTKEFLLRFGLSDLGELPSMEEFERMTQGGAQEELFERGPVADATGVPDEPPSGSAQPETAEAESHS